MNLPDSPEVRELAEDIAVYVNGGDTVEAAIRRLQRYRVPTDILEQARKAYEIKVGRIRDLRDPGALVDKERDYGYWYAGPKETDIFWPALRSRLLPSLGEGPVTDVHLSSNKVLGLMRPPGASSIDTRGLVLGYVQSGKTTSFMSVISKAADVGYRLFIVLSGITDNLRSQTQERLESVLVGDLDKEWYRATGLEEDFQSPGNAANLLSRRDHRLLAVVKKNPYRLQRLVRWIESAGELTLKQCPILIIDDEADQASLDVGLRGRTSRINGLIKQLLRQPKAAYVAYTATPFANLLISTQDFEDLYPRDFVVDLPRPDTYFGPERIFGRDPITSEEERDDITEGLDIVRYVEPGEIAAVQPPRGKGAVYSWDPAVPESLESALCWFALATAARRVRGVGTQHSTMLIHTSMLAEAHERLGQPVNALLKSLLTKVRNADRKALANLEHLWQAESNRVPPQDDASTPVGWDEVLKVLPDVLDQVGVVVDNYKSAERLSYSDDAPTTAVVIGGNTLSRGLTLEGLVCSYFVRAASAYDTLLQMGRWFGYRRGYGDLVRIWMTSDLEAWFFDLATVEEEIRRDIRRYEDEGLSPSELPVKIRSHPAMAITSAAKMRNAVRAEVSYGGSRQQTILFDHKNKVWLEENITAARALIRRSIDDGSSPKPTAGRYVIRDVDAASVLQFIGEYHFHERAYQMRRDLLMGYIESQNQQGYLKKWNVVVMGHPSDENGPPLPLGLEEPVNLITRSRMDMPGIAHANIKSLVSTIDRVADVPKSRADIRDMIDGDVTDQKLLKLREQLVGDVGLLCLYPISKESTPRDRTLRKGKRRRLPLDAVEHVIGAAFFFPESRGLTGGYSYYSADLSTVPVEDSDEDIEALDAADQAAGEAEDRRES